MGDALKSGCHVDVHEFLGIYKKIERIASKYAMETNSECYYNFLAFGARYNIDNPAAPFLYGCSAGKTKFEIVPNGDVYPCSFFFGRPEWRIGNVLEDDMKQL